MAELINMCNIETEEDKNKKHPEDKVYLVCLKTKEDSGIDDMWDIIIGRTNVYTHIKDHIDYIDLENSFVLVETQMLKDRKSIYAFMKYVADLTGDVFDIDDYIIGDWDEDYFKINNNTNIVPSEEKFDMIKSLNNDYNIKDL